VELVGAFMIRFSTKPLAILFVIAIKPETKQQNISFTQVLFCCFTFFKILLPEKLCIFQLYFST